MEEKYLDKTFFVSYFLYGSPKLRFSKKLKEQAIAMEEKGLVDDWETAYLLMQACTEKAVVKRIEVLPDENLKVEVIGNRKKAVAVIDTATGIITTLNNFKKREVGEMRQKVKREAETKIKRAIKDKVAQVVDEYGEVDKKIKELSKIKELCRKEILEWGPGEYEGEQFTISYKQRESLLLDPLKVAKKVGTKAFLQMVTVSVEKAKLFLSEKELEECVKETKQTDYLTVKEKK